METAIFHSVNAGLYFWDGRNGLLIDAIHEGREEGLSPMPAFLAGQLRCRSGLFGHVTGMLFTHLHHDHYDTDKVRQFQQSAPGLPVYGPNLMEGRVELEVVRPDTYHIVMGGTTLWAWDTCHDGNTFAGTPHQSFLLALGRERFFVAGDAALNVSDAIHIAEVCRSPVTAAFCNLYQLASPDGREFLRMLSPEQVFLYHLPFSEDDHCGYHRLARQVLRNYPADLPSVERLDHMAWLDNKAARWGNQICVFPPPDDNIFNTLAAVPAKILHQSDPAFLPYEEKGDGEQVGVYRP